MASLLCFDYPKSRTFPFAVHRSPFTGAGRWVEFFGDSNNAAGDCTIPLTLRLASKQRRLDS
jgi:hypothetical protein